jgi:hypothetical protein
MSLLSTIIQKYIEINFIFYAYTVGYLYLAVIYLPSFFIGPLKKNLSEFEQIGTNRSAFIIAVISGTFLYVCFLLLVGLDPTTGFSPFILVLWFIGYVVWGYFALFLLADYKRKFRKKESIL